MSDVIYHDVPACQPPATATHVCFSPPPASFNLTAEVIVLEAEDGGLWKGARRAPGPRQAAAELVVVKVPAGTAGHSMQQ